MADNNLLTKKLEEMMGIFYRICAAAAAAVFAVGCTNSSHLGPATTSQIGIPASLVTSGHPIYKNCQFSPISKTTKQQQVSIIPFDQLASCLMLSSSNDSNMSNWKKDLATMMMMSSDEACYRYLRRVETTEKGLLTSIDVIQKLASAGSAVTSPVWAANTFGIVSSSTDGLQTSLPERFFRSKNSELIFKSIITGRAQQRQKLMQFASSQQQSPTFNAVLENGAIKLVGNSLIANANDAGRTKAQTTDFRDFLSKFQEYHHSCTIPYGLGHLHESLQ